MVAHLLTVGAHALGEVEPHLAVRTALNLLFAQVAQHGAALLAVFQPRVQRAEVRGKCCDVVVVIGGILAQIFARQFTGRPRFVIWMAKKIITGNALLERAQKNLQFHESPHKKFRPGIR